MNIKKIAVLIPVKNCALTINRAIKSVQEQTYFKNSDNDYIIYIIDDHSDDGLYDIVKNIEKVKYIKNKHFGISSALNTGIFDIINDDSIDYIARLDGDDEWLSTKMEIQFNFLKNNPDIDICGTGIALIGKTNNFYGSYDETHEEIIKCIKEKNLNPVCHASTVINKRIFYYCGMYNDIRLKAEDFELWKRCMQLGCKFHNIKDVLMNVYAKEVDFTCMGLKY